MAKRVLAAVWEQACLRPKAAALIAAFTLLYAGILVNSLALQPGRHPAPLFAQTRVDAAAPENPVAAASTAAIGRAAWRAPAPEPQVSSGAALTRIIQAELDRKAEGSGGTRTQTSILRSERGSQPAGSRQVGPGLERAPRVDAPERPLSRLRTGAGQPEGDLSVVLAVQRHLANLGYAPGRVDGQMGEGTRRAIQRFELDRGLSASGRIDARLLQELTRVTGEPAG